MSETLLYRIYQVAHLNKRHEFKVANLYFCYITGLSSIYMHVKKGEKLFTATYLNKKLI